MEYAQAINDLGIIAGYSANRALLYDTHRNQTIPLESPAGFTNATPYDINNAGQVIGIMLPSQIYPEHGFIYQHDRATDLGPLGIADGRASYYINLVINDAGVVVGALADPDRSVDYHAFRYQDGTFADLNTLTLTGFHDILVRAVDINNAGQIVCQTFRMTTPPQPQNYPRSYLLTPQSIPSLPQTGDPAPLTAIGITATVLLALGLFLRTRRAKSVIPQ